MTTNTNVIDMTDHIATTEFAAIDDTVKIPTYMRKPMLPPVPGVRVPASHRAPRGLRRGAFLLTAATLGAALVPFVAR